jgi:hypothetical protein
MLELLQLVEFGVRDVESVAGSSRGLDNNKLNL